MKGRCEICGKPTLGPKYRLCMQCHTSGGVVPDRKQGNMSRPAWESKPGQARGKALPPGYLTDGYFDDDGYLHRQVIVEDAQKMAHSLLKARPQMTSAALRRYFSQARAIQSIYTQNRDFGAVKVGLNKLEALVAYSVGRNVVPGLFQEFILVNIELAARDEEHFLAFMDHFQSLVAFFREADGRIRR